MMRRVMMFCLVVGMTLTFAATEPGLAAGPDPLEGIQIVPPDPNLPDDIKFFSGYWEGTWMGDRRAGRTTSRLVVSEIISKEEAVATAATDTLITRNKEKAKIKRQDDGRLYLEFPPLSVGTLIYIAYPDKGELKGVGTGRQGSIEATMKKKQ